MKTKVINDFAILADLGTDKDGHKIANCKCLRCQEIRPAKKVDIVSGHARRGCKKCK